MASVGNRCAGFGNRARIHGGNEGEKVRRLRQLIRRLISRGKARAGAATPFFGVCQRAGAVLSIYLDWIHGGRIEEGGGEKGRLIGPVH